MSAWFASEKLLIENDQQYVGKYASIKSKPCWKYSDNMSWNAANNCTNVL